MAALTEHKATKTQKVLVTGLSGSGKSTLVAHLAEVYKLIWIDLERGASTLTKLPREWQEHINLISLPDSASYPIASDTLTQLFKSGKASICVAHGKVNCGLCRKDGSQFDDLDFNTLTGEYIVVVDTVTQLSHSILAHITRAEPVDYKPERDDWGSLRKLTEFFCSQFQAAQFNLVCIAHLTEAKLEDGKTKLVASFGSAAMSAEFSKAFDHVVYCDVRNGKHVAGSATNYSASVLTKSRTDFCIEKLPTPSLLPIFTVPSAVDVEAGKVDKVDKVAVQSAQSEVTQVTQVTQAATPPTESTSSSKLLEMRAKIAARNITKP